MEAIILVGIQASGKSTFYQRYFYRTHIRLSLDMLKTRNRERILLAACIEAKQPVVIDNTNPTREERARYIEPLKKAGFRIKGYYLRSQLGECLARNILRTGKERIPEVGIAATYRKLVLPSYEEGFDELFYVVMRGEQFIIKQWSDEV